VIHRASGPEIIDTTSAMSSTSAIRPKVLRLTDIDDVGWRPLQEVRLCGARGYHVDRDAPMTQIVGQAAGERFHRHLGACIKRYTGRATASGRRGDDHDSGPCAFISIEASCMAKKQPLT
jgi:hypothetical protein